MAKQKTEEKKTTETKTAEKIWIKLSENRLFAGFILIILSSSITYAITKYRQEVTELSYSVGEPIAYLTPDKVSDVEITVNGKKTNNMYATEVIIWNSGTTALKDIPVRFLYTPLAQFLGSKLPLSIQGPVLPAI